MNLRAEWNHDEERAVQQTISWVFGVARKTRERGKIRDLQRDGEATKTTKFCSVQSNYIAPLLEDDDAVHTVMQSLYARVHLAGILDF